MSHTTYTNFVSSSDDLVGLIAYSIYKADKLRFCQQHQDPQALDGFIKTVNMPEHVAAYKTRAVSLLEDMTEEAIGNAIETIQNEFDGRLRTFEKTTGFWRGVASNVIASVAAAAIVIAVTLLAYGNKIGFASVIGDALDLDIKPKSTSSQPPTATKQ